MILGILFFALNTLAYNAVVTVLEAPLFRLQDEKSHVIQYKRKGDKVYIHRHFNDDVFFKTMTTTGDQAFIYKNHVKVFVNSTREIDQKYVDKDNTDYRVQEPLRKNYPFIIKHKKRADLFISFGAHNSPTSPDNETVVDNAYSLNKKLSFSWSKVAHFDPNERYYWGGQVQIAMNSYTSQYSNYDKEENLFRLAVAPYISYDLWKNQKHLFRINALLNVSLFETIKVVAQSQEVTYRSHNIFPSLGFKYNRVDLFGDTDISFGVESDFFSSSSFSHDSGSEVLDKRFRTRPRIEISFNFGVTSSF